MPRDVIGRQLSTNTLVIDTDKLEVNKLIIIELIWCILFSHEIKVIVQDGYESNLFREIHSQLVNESTLRFYY